MAEQRKIRTRRAYHTLNETDIRTIASLALNDWSAVWIVRFIRKEGWMAYGIYGDNALFFQLDKEYNASLKVGDTDNNLHVKVDNQRKIFEYLKKRGFIEI